MQVSRTVIEVSRAPGGSGRVRVRTQSGLLRPAVTRATEAGADITLVATGATLLGGDAIEVEICLEDGVRLDLSDVAGTVAYDGRGQRSSWNAQVRVGAGSTLAWHGQPLIISSGAEVTRNLDVDLAPTAHLLMRDVTALGRTSESGGDLTCHTRMSISGVCAFAEDLDLSSDARLMPGVLGPNRVIDSVTALGWQPTQLESGTARFFDCEAPGMFARALAIRAHESDCLDVWNAWRNDLDGVRGRGS